MADSGRVEKVMVALVSVAAVFLLVLPPDITRSKQGGFGTGLLTEAEMTALPGSGGLVKDCVPVAATPCVVLNEMANCDTWAGQCPPHECWACAAGGSDTRRCTGPVTAKSCVEFDTGICANRTPGFCARVPLEEHLVCACVEEGGDPEPNTSCGPVKDCTATH